MRALPPDSEVIWRIARAIASVIAEKTLAGDRAFQRMDGVGRMMARNTLADRMAPELAEEARAALEAVKIVLGDADGQAA